MPDGKYITFKRADFCIWLEAARDMGAFEVEMDPSVMELEDAVVIRRQDLFAPPALDAYANSIQVALSILNHPDEVLSEIADYFHEQAVLSWQTERKLPD